MAKLLLFSHFGPNTLALLWSNDMYLLYKFKSNKYSGKTVFRQAPHSCKNLINLQYCSLICKALLFKSCSKFTILSGGSFPIKFLTKI